MKIAIFGKRRQSPEDIVKIFEMLKELSSLGIMTAIESRFYGALHRAAPERELEVDEVFDNRDFTADYAFSIGGDGTFLATARMVADKQIPIAGFNTGTLGFLAEENLDKAREVIQMLLTEDYEIENRGLIRVTTSDSALNFDEWPVALNEVAIMRHDTDAMITVTAGLDGRELAVARGDGLLIATPTGSTAYNLSVGGPIVAPSAPCRIISPIAPHSLTLRPMVVPDDCRIEISVKVRGDSYRLAIDGRALTVPADTRLELTRPDFVTRIIRPRGHNFVRTLHDKLLWSAK